MSVFNGKTILITGGTGSFGSAALRRMLSYGAGEVRILSRDKAKQDALRKEYPSESRLKFIAGDILKADICREAVAGADFIFHAAAMKDIPGCEKDPLGAVETNILGTATLLKAAVEAGVEAVVYLSTDKAAYPVNVMGNTKAIGEKIAVSLSDKGTRIVCTRFGNVLCSQGSVVPLWKRQVAEGKPVTVTNPDMTRFIMTIEEALDLVLYAFENGKTGDILVQKSPACTIGLQAQGLCELEGGSGVTVIGARPGEKLYETLLTKEEGVKAQDMGGFFRIPAVKDHTDAPVEEYNSDNAPRMNLEEIKAKLREAMSAL
ncbi:MAG: polysaccharide biosynthesis protein [Bacteroidales bacterium]|nr:polysaccharide biosynthesis protein [Bacteroidales bacterium]